MQKGSCDPAKYFYAAQVADNQSKMAILAHNAHK
jgi:hypothetical protein